jgi:arabinogalactan endo-1,4-beta-galactosidase
MSSKMITTKGSTMSRQVIGRRGVLKAAASGAVVLSVGQLVAARPAAAATTFYKGADISWVPQLESQGSYWRDASGVRQDIFTILKGYGL